MTYQTDDADLEDQFQGHQEHAEQQANQLTLAELDDLRNKAEAWDEHLAQQQQAEADRRASNPNVDYGQLAQATSAEDFARQYAAQGGVVEQRTAEGGLVSDAPQQGEPQVDEGALQAAAAQGQEAFYAELAKQNRLDVRSGYVV